MCGICGIFSNSPKKEKEIFNLISKMISSIAYRGPDGSNQYINSEIALGFCRLSFVDLTGGMQPICNEDTLIKLVCNGEIFNHNELRHELIKKGHVFRTKTDVETIIHLYEEEGIDFVKRLNGQFAIALYDEREHKLILARDHFGIAPLYYTFKDGSIIFASEIKAILEYPGIQRKINLEAVDQVLNFPGIVSPTTFFKYIYALQPGHLLICNQGDSVENYEYWDLRYDKENEDLGEQYYIDNLKNLFIDSINRRLIADVPIGFYISGGLDSSIVACFIDKFIPGKYKSFSAEVISGNSNEASFQKIIKNIIKSDNYSVEINDSDLYKLLPDVVYHAEAGLRESYDIASYQLSKLVQTTDVRAVLTGQGSDEFFYGYVGYLSDVFRKNKKNVFSNEEQELNERLWGDPFFRYERNHVELINNNLLLYSKEIKDDYWNFSALNKSPIDLSKVSGLNSFRRRSYIDSKLRLADHLLIDHGDKMSFAHSIESRHPFLDINLIEFAKSIPDNYKLRGTQEKYILKKMSQGIVPSEIINRKKFPFQTPGMSYIIKKNPLVTEKYLNPDTLNKHGIFDSNYIEKLKMNYLSEETNIDSNNYLDNLLVVFTISILCEKFNLKV